MAKEKQALKGFERDAFEMQVSVAIAAGDEAKKALIDNLLSEGKLDHIAYIVRNEGHAKAFKTALKPVWISEARGEISISQYLMAENHHLAELKAIKEAQAKKRSDLELKAKTLSKARYQEFVNDLVDAKEWGLIAYLLLEPDGRFKEEIANVAVLLPSDLNSYMEVEAKNLAIQQFSHDATVIEEQVENVTENLRKAIEQQEAELQKIKDKYAPQIQPFENRQRGIENERAKNNELKAREIRGVKRREEHEINKIEKAGYKSPETRNVERRIRNTKKAMLAISPDALKAEIEYYVDIESKIKALETELKEDAEIGGAESALASVEKGVRSFFGVEVPTQETTFKEKLTEAEIRRKKEDLANKKVVMRESMEGWKARGIDMEGIVKQLRDYDAVLANDNKLLAESKAKDAKVLEERIAEQRKIAEGKVVKIDLEFAEKEQGLKMLEGKIKSRREGVEAKVKEEADKINVAYTQLIERLAYDQQHMATQRAAFLEGRESEINRISTSLLKGASDLQQNPMKSLTYLAKDGRIGEVVNYLYKGAGKDNAALRNEFLNSIRDDVKIIDEMTTAIVGLSDTIRLEFAQSLVDSSMLNGLKGRLDKLGIDEKTQNDLASRLITKGGKFGPAYEILKGNNNLKLFQVLANSRVNSYETLKFYHDTFEDPAIASKSAGELIANSPNFFTILKGIPDLNQSLVDEKINLASILSDAYRAVEISALSPEEKQRRQAELEKVYEEKCFIGGKDNSLPVILKSYSEKGIYNALKVAAYEAGKIGAKVEVAGGDIAEVILYAPNLVSFAKTKDALDKATAKAGIGEKLGIGDKFRAFFAPLLSLLDIIPEPKELMDITAYMVGLKRVPPQDLNKDEIQRLKAAKDQLAADQGIGGRGE